MHQVVDIHALSHITGGGLLENIPRVLPDNMQAVIDANSWQRPAIFDWLQQQGNVETKEMYRTFNNGIGMVVVVDNKDVDNSLDVLKQAGEDAVVIGHIAKLNGTEEQVVVVN